MRCHEYNARFLSLKYFFLRKKVWKYVRKYQITQVKKDTDGRRVNLGLYNDDIVDKSLIVETFLFVKKEQIRLRDVSAMNREIEKETANQSNYNGSLASEREYLSHTNPGTTTDRPKTILAHVYTTHCLRYFCTRLLTTLHYFNLADADQRFAASSSRASNAGGRDGSRHPVHPRATRARGLIELLACHAGWATSRCWLHHVAGCHCNRQHPQ